MDEDQRNAISALGEENLEHLRKLAAVASEQPEEAWFHDSGEQPSVIHGGKREDCAACMPDEKREVPPSFFGVPDGTADQRIANADQKYPARTLIGPDERDQLASIDQGQYYCVSARHGTLVCRNGRPVYATLAEWQSIDSAVRGGVYVPTTGPSQAEPLFGSLPLMDRGGTPDIVGRLIELITFLEKAAALLGDRITVLDKVAGDGVDGLKDLGLLVSQRIHFVELLDRAAALLDSDNPTYEQRLDWLAKWREVVGR